MLFNHISKQNQAQKFDYFNREKTFLGQNKSNLTFWNKRKFNDVCISSRKKNLLESLFALALRTDTVIGLLSRKCLFGGGIFFQYDAFSFEEFVSEQGCCGLRASLPEPKCKNKSAFQSTGNFISHHAQVISKLQNI